MIDSSIIKDLMEMNKISFLLHNGDDYEQIVGKIGLEHEEKIKNIIKLSSDLLVEKRLILQLINSKNQENIINKFIDVIDRIDWGFVITNCIHHKILQLFWENVCKFDIVNHIPVQITRLFNNMYYSNGIRNDVYFLEVETVLQELNKNNIKVLMTKGSYLINNVYSKYARTINDIDLIIEKKNVKQVVDIIQSKGYIFFYGFDWKNCSIIPMNRHQQLFWQMDSHNLPVLSKQTSSPFAKYVNIDVGIDLFSKKDKYKFKVEEMFSRSMEYKIGNTSVNVLSREDFLIHLCTHLYRESISDACVYLGQDLNLIKFCDIYEYIIKFNNEIDWNKFIVIAKDNNCIEPIYFSLYYTNLIFNDENINILLNKFNISDYNFLFDNILIDKIDQNIFFNYLFKFDLAKIKTNDSFFDKLKKLKV